MRAPDLDLRSIVYCSKCQLLVADAEGQRSSDEY